MTTNELILRTIITLEPGRLDRKAKTLGPSYYAVWLQRGDLIVYYGRATTRLLAGILVNEIAQGVGVERELEV